MSSDRMNGCALSHDSQARGVMASVGVYLHRNDESGH